MPFFKQITNYVNFENQGAFWQTTCDREAAVATQNNNRCCYARIGFSWST